MTEQNIPFMRSHAEVMQKIERLRRDHAQVQEKMKDTPTVNIQLIKQAEIINSFLSVLTWVVTDDEKI